MLDELPDDCTLEDVQYEVYFLDLVQRGRAEADAGKLVSHDQVMSELRRKWSQGRAELDGPRSRGRLRDEALDHAAEYSIETALALLDEAERVASSLAAMSERGRQVRRLTARPFRLAEPPPKGRQAAQQWPRPRSGGRRRSGAIAVGSGGLAP